MRRALFIPLLFSVAARGACLAQADVSDLPVVELRAAHSNGWMAVLITGDGGWRAIDRDVARGLNTRGVDVVGLVAPDYFAVRRTPEESSCALLRMIEHYSLAWRAPHVIVSGYSRGAGVAPFMLNRLPPRWRARVQLVALIGLDRTIDFEVSKLDLLRSGPAPREVPVHAEVERLRGTRVLCVYGERDRHTACRDFDPLLLTAVPEPGGHHFSGDYDRLAALIWSAR
jgi:type IV secretory pathway VirJ component